jgi:hypothetical protein
MMMMMMMMMICLLPGLEYRTSPGLEKGLRDNKER